MPYAANGGVRIRYEVGGSGVPLVLHPGFIGSLEDWDDAAYVTALRDRYRLILLDPRGQGRSDKPHDPAAYAARRRVDDVLAVLDAERIEQAHFWGFSMGGWIGLALGVAKPDRFRSLVLGAASAFDGNPRSAESDPFLKGFRKGMTTLVQEWEGADPNFWLSAGERERWLAADVEALTADRVQRLTEPSLDMDAIAAISVPTLLYVGTDDGFVSTDAVQRAARLMPNAECVTLEGLDHAQTLARSDLVLPHVLAFLAKVDSTATAIK